MSNNFRCNDNKVKLPLFTIMFFATLFSILGCSNVHKANESQINKVHESTQDYDEVSTEVMQALALAKQKKDYRLWVTTSRSIAVPGLEPSDFNLAMKLCGKQYMPKTGDVIRSEQERVERKKLITFMQQYNEKMWVICANNKNTKHK